MVKFNISMSDYVFDTYLSTYMGNRSKLIEEKMVRGFEADNGDFVEYKKKYFAVLNDINELKKRNHILEMTIEKLKLNNKSSKELTESQIISKYELNTNHLNYLKDIKEILAEKPFAIKGNFNRFKNDFDVAISFNEFERLVKGDNNAE